MAKQPTQPISPEVLRIKQKMLAKGIKVRDLEKRLNRSRVSIANAWKGRSKSLLGQIKEFVNAA